MQYMYTLESKRCKSVWLKKWIMLNWESSKIKCLFSKNLWNLLSKLMILLIANMNWEGLFWLAFMLDISKIFQSNLTVCNAVHVHSLWLRSNAKHWWQNPIHSALAYRILAVRPHAYLILAWDQNGPLAYKKGVWKCIVILALFGICCKCFKA